MFGEPLHVMRLNLYLKKLTSLRKWPSLARAGGMACAVNVRKEVTSHAI